MNGTELAQRIHENHGTAQLPIFVITADSQMSENPVFQGTIFKSVTLEALRKLLAPDPETK